MAPSPSPMSTGVSIIALSNDDVSADWGMGQSQTTSRPQMFHVHLPGFHCYSICDNHTQLTPSTYFSEFMGLSLESQFRVWTILVAH